ncbi:MAG: fibronectin type III-like domain-contianing protein, partial [Acidimicrobiales bacterium]
PPSAGEPPEQLRGFSRVTLGPGSATEVWVTIPRSGFSSWINGTWRVPRGRYSVAIGTDSEHLSIRLPAPVPPA